MPLPKQLKPLTVCLYGGEGGRGRVSTQTAEKEKVH